MLRLLLAIFAFTIPFTQALAQENIIKCATNEAMAEFYLNTPEKLNQYLQDLEEFNSTTGDFNLPESGQKIIPTVIHVMHYNGAGNVSDAQVIDGLNQINEDLKRINDDTTLTRDFFKPVAGASDIEFRLAKIDPLGNCTNGIVRFNTGSTNNFGGTDVLQSIWPNDKYFNIWIVNNIANFTGGAGIILGYAYYPGNGGNPLYGVVNRNDAWGRIGDIRYVGRTPTHEIGHALNLAHTFDQGCGFDCTNSGDFVCDTPPAGAPTQGCNVILDNCPNDAVGSSPTDSLNPNPYTFDSINQIENYMSYDDCQNMFSHGQVLRMYRAIDQRQTLIDLTDAANLIATGVDDAYFFTAPTCAPIDEFSSNIKIQCEGNAIEFQDLSYNAFIDSTWQWNWTFQGGTPATSTDRHPTVTYNAPGQYDVTLSVSNSQGASPSVTKSSFVEIKEGSGNFIAPALESFSAQEFPANNSDATLNWTIDKPAGSAIGWERSTNAFFTGPASVRLNNFNINTEGLHTLFSPTADLTQMTQAFLNFRLAYARRSNEIELLYISASTDCGATWNGIATELSINFFSSTWPANIPYLPSDGGQWKAMSYDISKFAGMDNIMFKIEFRARGGNDVYIDDFEIANSPLAVGLNERANITETNIYPNPSSGQINIQSQGIKIIEVFDLVGNLVYSKEYPQDPINEVQLDLSELQSGLYFLDIQSENRTKHKIVLE